MQVRKASHKVKQRIRQNYLILSELLNTKRNQLNNYQVNQTRGIYVYMYFLFNISIITEDGALNVFISSLSLYSVNQYNEEQYISCVTEEPLMSVRYYAYEIFDSILGRIYSTGSYYIGCGYSSSTLISRCVYVLLFFLLH